MTYLYVSEIDDSEYNEYPIEEIEPQEGGWVLKHNEGWCFWCPTTDAGIVPQAGQIARFYGRGIGYIVRGLAIDGRIVFYRSDAGEERRFRQEIEENDQRRRTQFETERTRLDADYAALPAPFRARLDRFRTNNPDFRWRFEPYELFVCQEAVKIADALQTTEAVKAFPDMSSDEQAQRVPSVAFDEHSGNTFAMACALAYWYLKNPEQVAYMHGALSPLVGSETYGDIPALDQQPHE